MSTTSSTTTPQPQPPHPGLWVHVSATYTVNGGSRMLDEVRDAMADANTHHLDLNDLNAAAGAKIASLLQVPQKPNPSQLDFQRPPPPLRLRVVAHRSQRPW